MQKGTVLDLKRFRNILEFLQNNWCLLLLSAMFIFGIVFGTLRSEHISLISKLAESVTSNYLKIRIENQFWNITLDSLLINLAFYILCFIFGTSPVGVTFVPLIILFRGTFFGVLASTVYAKYSLKGIALNALILIPPTIIFAIFLIIAAGESMRYSLRVIDITLPQTAPSNLNRCFGAYCKKYLILILPIILSALLDGWLSIKFISYFNL